MSSLRFPIIPASFFGMVLGLSGLGACWRLAAQVWRLPGAIGEAIIILAVAVWAILVLLYAMKWALARDDVLKEAAHPVQCCFIGLVGVATMLAALGLLPYAGPAAIVLFTAGSLYTLVFAIWRMGGLWQGDRPDTTNTPVLYLPAVAGSFVTTAGLGAIGHAEWGQYFFGAGLFTWLGIESVLLHRFFNAAPLPPAMRPTLGIQLAPAPVGAVAYLSITQGPPDVFAHALIGYGILQALILLRLSRWIAEEGFTPGYWAFTFGATALAAAPLRLIARGDDGAIVALAPVLFMAANIIVVLVAAATVRRLVAGKLPVGWAHLGGNKADVAP